VKAKGQNSNTFLEDLKRINKLRKQFFYKE
jgi:hypothetical protein